MKYNDMLKEMSEGDIERDRMLFTALKDILKVGCDAMDNRVPETADSALRIAIGLVEDVPAIAIDDFDLGTEGGARNGIYLSDVDDMVRVRDMSLAQVLGVIRTIMDRAQTAMANEYGLAAGQMLRYAYRVTQLAKI